MRDFPTEKKLRQPISNLQSYFEQHLHPIGWTNLHLDYPMRIFLRCARLLVFDSFVRPIRGWVFFVKLVSPFSSTMAQKSFFPRFFFTSLLTIRPKRAPSHPTKTLYTSNMLSSCQNGKIPLRQNSTPLSTAKKTHTK